MSWVCEVTSPQAFEGLRMSNREARSEGPRTGSCFSLLAFSEDARSEGPTAPWPRWITTSRLQAGRTLRLGPWDHGIMGWEDPDIFPGRGYKFQSDFCQLRMVGRIPRASLKRQTPERRLCADFCFSAVSASFSVGHCAFLPVSRGRLLPWKTMSRNLVDFPDGESIGSRQ